MAQYQNPQFKVGMDPAWSASPYAGAPSGTANPAPKTNPFFNGLGQFTAHPLDYLQQLFQKNVADPALNAGRSFQQGMNTPPAGGGCFGAQNTGP